MWRSTTRLHSKGSQSQVDEPGTWNEVIYFIIIAQLFRICIREDATVV